MVRLTNFVFCDRTRRFAFRRHSLTKFEPQRKPELPQRLARDFQTKLVIRLDHRDRGPGLSVLSVSLMQLTEFVLNVPNSNSKLSQDSF